VSRDILYLGSLSRSRQKLLTIAGVDYKVLEHKSEEDLPAVGLTFKDYVLSIAKDKMQNLILPEGKDDQVIFVLTADTLTKTISEGSVLGKPKDIEHAKWMLNELRKSPTEVFTGCCLDKKILNKGQWENVEEKHWVSTCEIEFYVDKDEFDLYFQNTPLALKASAAGIIEDFGLNYLKSVNGSYTTVLGLPLYEVRKALKEIRFRF